MPVCLRAGLNVPGEFPHRSPVSWGPQAALSACAWSAGWSAPPRWAAMIESVVHSPDRRYWWDGRRWQLAVSPDGHQWFDGTRWMPNPLAPPRVWNRPTGWTRPLQVAVVALTV